MNGRPVFENWIPSKILHAKLYGFDQNQKNYLEIQHTYKQYPIVKMDDGQPNRAKSVCVSDYIYQAPFKMYKLLSGHPKPQPKSNMKSSNPSRSPIGKTPFLRMVEWLGQQSDNSKYWNHPKHFN